VFNPTGLEARMMMHHHRKELWMKMATTTRIVTLLLAAMMVTLLSVNGVAYGAGAKVAIVHPRRERHPLSAARFLTRRLVQRQHLRLATATIAPTFLFFVFGLLSHHLGDVRLHF
jgi:hypothetical protein